MAFARKTRILTRAFFWRDLRRASKSRPDGHGGLECRLVSRLGDRGCSGDQAWRVYFTSGARQRRPQSLKKFRAAIVSCLIFAVILSKRHSLWCFCPRGTLVSPFHCVSHTHTPMRSHTGGRWVVKRDGRRERVQFDKVRLPNERRGLGGECWKHTTWMVCACVFVCLGLIAWSGMLCLARPVATPNSI